MAWSIVERINLIGQDTEGVFHHMVLDLLPIIQLDLVGVVL